MDYTNRNAQQNVAPSTAGAGSPVSPVSKKNSQKESGKWGRIAIVAGIAAIVVILVGLAVLAGTSNTKDSQSQYVDSSKLQAVFLNTGQVYFGNIKTLNSKYIVLTNIYYLQTSGGSSSTSSSTTANSNTNVSLVKLGCELHEPYDQMVINGSQVTFWENLQDGGQVAKAVKSFQQQNPNGQKCSDQSSSASTTSGNSAQNAGTSTKP